MRNYEIIRRAIDLASVADEEVESPADEQLFVRIYVPLRQRPGPMRYRSALRERQRKASTSGMAGCLQRLFRRISGR